MCFVTVISSVTSCRLPVGPFRCKEHRVEWAQDFLLGLDELNDELQLTVVNFRPIRAAVVATDFWDALTDREDLLRLWCAEDVVAYIRRQYEQTRSSNAA
jgi:hypothetical protein